MSAFRDDLPVLDEDEDYSVGKSIDSGESGSACGSKQTQDSTSNAGGGHQLKAMELASHETKAVACGKYFMLFILLAVAAASAATVFVYTSQQEQNEFEQRFDDVANQIVSVYQVNSAKISEIYENFAIQIAAYGQGTNVVWPFVLIPAFEALASRAMEQSGARTMAVAPLVSPEDRPAWENFTVEASNIWIEESFAYLEAPINMSRPQLSPYIFGSFGVPTPVEEPVEDYGIYAPVWQSTPIFGTRITNFDSFRFNNFPSMFDRIIRTNSQVLTEVRNLNPSNTDDTELPESIIGIPIYNKVVKHPKVDSIVAIMTSLLPWQNYFIDLLPPGIDGIFLVISNTCNQTFSYRIDGPSVTYLGPSDFHDTSYDSLEKETNFNPFDNEMECLHTISLYPSKEFESDYETNRPLIYTLVVIAIFIFTIGVFFLYDFFVDRRQTKVMTTAERSTAIVTSLFPERVADRLMENAGKKRRSPISSKVRQTPKRPIMVGRAPPRLSLDAQDINASMRDFEVSLNDVSDIPTKPIAELYPRATVFFGDIVGFTAWSSEREPSQVFELLEKIYSSFDRIAKRKRVFKVETIGDCYVAATGLPDTKSDHAIVMARFARDCLRKMLHVVRKLESRLGPSTGDLGMRIGIHSGPVTAGVLRGDKARFQLFGDTVNTAARMESTGCKNKIQVSAETAALIKKAQNPDIWVVPREEQIEAKGKGTMETFWLAYANMGGGRSLASTSSGDSLSIDNFTEASDSGDSVTEMLEDSHEDKVDRSIDWTVDVLQRLLKKIVAMRGTFSASGVTDISSQELFSKSKRGTTPLDEVVDIIDLPSQEKSYAINPQEIELPPQVLLQLRDYVRKISNMYNMNPFHNYEHATHVTMSVTKLLSRVVSPSSADLGREADLHEYTYGITSDPLAQFAVALAALIHDVDHPGVPNAVLVNERTEDAIIYKNLSVAEQKSVDLAWDLLAEPAYAHLRACIYGDKEEFFRFRQLVVNAVMATDIVDRELGSARKARWQKAFAKKGGGGTEDMVQDPIKDANRKATIVIEHLIQASDVAHTMQHWHIYTRWNERFFFECYRAYVDGRIDKDPSLDWYKDEIGFFDYYIIPLARKLKDCQVFGVASEEYLNYARANRQEWEAKGKGLVRQYLERFRKQDGSLKSAIAV